MPSRLKAKQAREAKRDEARQAIAEAEEERLRQEALAKGEVEEEEKPPEPEHQWLLVVGGLDGASVHASTELLHYQAEAFEEGLLLGTPRWGCAAIEVGLGRVLVVGGFDGKRYLETTEILDLKAWSVEPGPRMSLARCGCSAVRVNDRSILVIGGYSQDSCEILDLESMKFRPGPCMRRARASAAAVMLDEHRLMIAGGYDRLGCCKETEIMDLRRAPTEDEWDPSTPPNVEKARFQPWEDFKAPRGGCIVSPLPDKGRLLFIGGFDGKRRLASTELLDLANYPIPCDRRLALQGEPVLSLAEGGHVEKLWKPKKKAASDKLDDSDRESTDEEDEEEGDDADDAPPKPKVKTWTLMPDEQAEVVQVYEEGLEDQDGHEDASDNMFRLKNAAGFESGWLKMEEFAYVPTHQMYWEPAGPALEFARSGAAAALLPTRQIDEQHPRLFVIDGCGDVPNEALNTTEVLELATSGEFIRGPATRVRRAYCAAVTVTIEGDLGRPVAVLEEEEAGEDGETFPQEAEVSAQEVDGAATAALEAMA